MITSPAIDQLAAALVKAHTDFGPVKRSRIVEVLTKSGGKYTFAYAPLDTIMDAIKGPLQANGLALVQGVSRYDSGDVLNTRIIHSSGQWAANETPVVAQKTCSAQEYGSALTYARRYGVTMLMSLVADDDDDANSGDGNKARFLDEAINRHAKTIAGIKDCFAAEDWKGAAKLWEKISSDDKRTLWVAPSKGGPFSTIERELFRSSKFIEARKGAPEAA